MSDDEVEYYDNEWRPTVFGERWPPHDEDNQSRISLSQLSISELPEFKPQEQIDRISNQLISNRKNRVTLKLMKQTRDEQKLQIVEYDEAAKAIQAEIDEMIEQLAKLQKAKEQNNIEQSELIVQVELLTIWVSGRAKKGAMKWYNAREYQLDWPFIFTQNRGELAKAKTQLTSSIRKGKQYQEEIWDLNHRMPAKQEKKMNEVRKRESIKLYLRATDEAIRQMKEIIEEDVVRFNRWA